MGMAEKHVSVAMDMHATLELWDMMFSVTRSCETVGSR
jgi:hypothetical protein